MKQSLQIFAVQMKWEASDYRDERSFEIKIRSIMEQIKQKRHSDLPSLVVFPEDVGTPLLFTRDFALIDGLSTLREVIKKLLLHNLFPVLKNMLRYRVNPLRAFMLAKSRDAGAIYHHVFSAIAREYKVYLAAGSASLPDFTLSSHGDIEDYRISDGNIYNISYFYHPDGRLIGTQKKVHLVEGLEDKKGFNLSSGSLEDLKVFDTGIGKIGIAICLDCFQKPVTQCLADQGAEILLQPSANAGPWNAWQQEDWLHSSWETAKNDSRFLAAVNPMMTGYLFDLSFEGQSSIISFMEEHDQKNYAQLPPTEGFAALAKTHDEEEILHAVISLHQ